MTEVPDGVLFADDARRYRLDSRIATGGMGEVWRGTDTALDRQIAVKLLKHEYADDATFRQRFETEAQHAAGLSHPGIAAVYDFGESSTSGVADGSGIPRPFLVMEFVDGQPLSALLRGGASLDPEAVRDLLAQAGDAIGAAHRAGIVHRDIKPANLLVRPDRQVKITDFGIARAAEALGLTGTGQVMGTPQYLSPEQARGETATPASDVYSLGVVAFECLAGRRPFEAESPVATALAHIQQPVPELPPSVPTALSIVVRRAMSKDPGERFVDGTAFAAALRDPATAATKIAAASTRPTAPAPIPVPIPATTPVTLPPAYDDEGPSRWAWLAVVLLVLALIVVVLVLVFGDKGNDPVVSPTATPTTSSPSATESASPSDSATEPATFNLDPGQYVGRNVDEVASDLRALNLDVDTTPTANPGDQEADSVKSISPTRDLSEGDTVTVTYYEAPEPTEDPTPTPDPTTDPTPSEPTDPGTSLPIDPTASIASGLDASPEAGVTGAASRSTFGTSSTTTRAQQRAHA